MNRGNNWYNRNESREYPFAASATRVSDTGHLLPEAILAAARLRFDRGLGDRLFVSGVTMTPSLVSVALTAASGSSVTSPACSVSLPRPVIPYKPYPVDGAVPGVAGWLVFGSAVESGEGRWRFSSPAQSELCPRAAFPFRPAPVLSIGIQGGASLAGVVGLSGSGGVTVTPDVRVIDGEETPVLAIQLDPSVSDLFSRLAGPCGRNPESGTCQRTPIRRIGPATPDENGNIEVFSDAPENHGFEANPLEAEREDDGLLLISEQPLDAEGNPSGALIFDYALGIAAVKPPKLEPLLFSESLLSSESLDASSEEGLDDTADGCAPLSYPYETTFSDPAEVACYWDPVYGDWLVVLPGLSSSSSLFSSVSSSSSIPEDYSGVTLCFAGEGGPVGTFRYDGHYAGKPAFVSDDGWYLWNRYSIWCIGRDIGAAAYFVRTAPDFAGDYVSTLSDDSGSLAYGECPPYVPPSSVSSSSSSDELQPEESSEASEQSSFSSQEPAQKSLILFVVPGMSPVLEQAASRYFYGLDGALAFQDGGVATIDPASASSHATDYAALATALFTGRKVDNGVLCRAVPGDGSALETLGAVYRAAGKRVGLVTTSTLSDTGLCGAVASPASNTAQARWASVLSFAPDLVFGATDQAAGVTLESLVALPAQLATTKVQLNALASGHARYIGAFGDGPFPPAYDRRWSWLPSLSGMVEKACELLDCPEGFLLVVAVPAVAAQAAQRDDIRAISEIRDVELAWQAARAFADERGMTSLVTVAGYNQGAPALSETVPGGLGVYPDVLWSSSVPEPGYVSAYGYGLDAARICGFRAARELFALFAEEAWDGECPEAPAALGGTGLATLAYENAGLTGRFSLVPGFPDTFDFSWGFSGLVAGRPSNFSAEFRGFLTPRYTETYTFTATADDGVRVWLDGVLVIDAWDGSSGIPASGTALLIAGFSHVFRVEYRQVSGSASLRVEWASAGQTREAIPKDNLTPADVVVPPDTDDGQSSLTDGGTSSSGSSLIITPDEAYSDYVLARDADTTQPPTAGCTETGLQLFTRHPGDEGSSDGVYVASGFELETCNGVYSATSELSGGYPVFTSSKAPGYKLYYRANEGWVLTRPVALGLGIEYTIQAAAGGFPRYSDIALRAGGESTGRLSWVRRGPAYGDAGGRYVFYGITGLAGSLAGTEAAQTEPLLQSSPETSNGYTVFKSPGAGRWRLRCTGGTTWVLEYAALSGAVTPVLTGQAGSSGFPEPSGLWAPASTGVSSYAYTLSWEQASAFAGTAAAIGCVCPEDFALSIRQWEAVGTDSAIAVETLSGGPGILEIEPGRLASSVEDLTLAYRPDIAQVDAPPENLITGVPGYSVLPHFICLKASAGPLSTPRWFTLNTNAVYYGTAFESRVGDRRAWVLRWYSSLNAWVLLYVIRNGFSADITVHFRFPASAFDYPVPGYAVLPDDVVTLAVVAHDRVAYGHDALPVPQARAMSAQYIFTGDYVPAVGLSLCPGVVTPFGSADAAGHTQVYDIDETCRRSLSLQDLEEALALQRRKGVFQRTVTWFSAGQDDTTVYLSVLGDTLLCEAPGIALDAVYGSLYMFAPAVNGEYPPEGWPDPVLWRISGYSLFEGGALSFLEGYLSSSSSSSYSSETPFRVKLNGSSGFDTDGWLELEETSPSTYTGSFEVLDPSTIVPYAVRVVAAYVGGRWTFTFSAAGSGSCDSLSPATPPPDRLLVTSGPPGRPYGYSAPFVVTFSGLGDLDRTVLLTGTDAAAGLSFQGAYHSAPYATDPLNPAGLPAGDHIAAGYVQLGAAVAATGAEVSVTLQSFGDYWLLTLATTGSHYRPAAQEAERLLLHWVCGDAGNRPDGAFVGSLGQAAFDDLVVDGERPDIQYSAFAADRVALLDPDTVSGAEAPLLERDYRSGDNVYSSGSVRLCLDSVGGELNWKLVYNGDTFRVPVPATLSALYGLPFDTLTLVHPDDARAAGKVIRIDSGRSYGFARLLRYKASDLHVFMLRDGATFFGSVTGVWSNASSSYFTLSIVSEPGEDTTWKTLATSDPLVTGEAEYYDGTDLEMAVEPSFGPPAVTLPEPSRDYTRFKLHLAGLPFAPGALLPLQEVALDRWEASYVKLVEITQAGLSSYFAVDASVVKGAARWYVTLRVRGTGRSMLSVERELLEEGVWLTG